MTYYKKKINAEGKRNLISDDFLFDRIVIFGDYERGDVMKSKGHAVKVIVISAICAAVVGAAFAIVRKSKV